MWWLRPTLGVTSLAIVVFVAAGLLRLAPLARDDLALDRIVRVVALDWRDFGYPVARQRLQASLDREVGPQVGDDHCELRVDADGTRRVACAWSVDVRVPMTERDVRLSFSSQAAVDPSGALVR